MASLGDITTAASGLAAARRLIDVAGQNIGNSNTAGYTRRSVTVQSVGLTPTTGQSTPVVSGGVSVSAMQRATSEPANAQLRAATADDAYSSTRSTALGRLEDGLGTISTGISTQLTSFWSSWSDLASSPSNAGAGQTVLQNAATLASSISSGYQTAATQWTSTRDDLSSQLTALNGAADSLASVNRSLATAASAGRDTSDLLDQRDALLTSISKLAGGTTSSDANGAATVVVGGGVLVDSTSSYHVQLVGGQTPGSAVSIGWTGHSGTSLAVDGGSVAADLSLIAPSDSSGTGGAISEALTGYNSLATSLASTVNAIHETGTTTSGATGLDFFAIGDSANPATSLSVVPTSTSQIASAASGAGALDSTIADRISQLGTATTSPNVGWNALVSRVGAQAAAESTAATSASTALDSATSAQQSVSSVDLDEENENLLTAQSAYQANARVLTTIDQMLDTLINKTGLVGIS